jgi:hypothetical protein
MVDKQQPPVPPSFPAPAGQFGVEAGDASGSARRVPAGAHRADVRDTVAELADRARAISQEAGSKVSAAMKDVIGAAAGIAGFAIESARDLVQYMVRRGQITPEEGEKLIREAEAAHGKRHKPAAKPTPPMPGSAITKSAAAAKPTAPPPAPPAKTTKAAKPAPVKAGKPTKKKK